MPLPDWVTRSIGTSAGAMPSRVATAAVGLGNALAQVRIAARHLLPAAAIGS